jgi:hypothetical protein
MSKYAIAKCIPVWFIGSSATGRLYIVGLINNGVISTMHAFPPHQAIYPSLLAPELCIPS